MPFRWQSLGLPVLESLKVFFYTVNMIVIVTALHAEAKPLIRHWRLKKDLSVTSHQLFLNDQMLLIVSGIGKCRAAAATGYIAGLKAGADIKAFLNIGVCAASPKFKIADCYFINKIRCLSSAKSVYPDVLINHSLEEASLLTVEQPAKESSFQNEGFELLDMEGFGFFQAASQFLSPDKIACLKVVSDHLQPKTVTAALATQLIEQNLRNIDSLVEAYSQRSDCCKTELLDEQTLLVIARLSEVLRLTHAQREQLKQWVAVYLVKGAKSISDLEGYCLEKPKTKEQSKEILRQIKRLLVHG